MFLTLGVIWGMPYLLIKIAVVELTPATLVFGRTFLAALLLLPLAAIRGQLRGLVRHWKPLLVFTAVEMVVPWVLLASAEQRLSSSLTGLLIATVPLVGALLGWFTGGERLGWRRLLGLGVGFAGVAALVGLDLGADDAWALVQIAVVVIGYAVGPFLLHRYLGEQSSLGVMAVALTVSALVYLPVGLIQAPPALPSGKVLLAVVLLAVFCSAVALVVFSALIAEVGPVRTTVITYVNPAVAIVLGIIFLSEPFTLGIAVGFALVLVGSFLATYRSPEVAGNEPGLA